MAGHVLKRRRLSNPRRRMSAKQIKYFGSKRQKAALKNRRRNRGRRRHNQGSGGGVVSQAEHAAQRAITAVERAAEDAIGDVSRVVNRRRRNVGEILTVLPANRGRRRKNKGMARAANRRRNRRTNARRRTYNRTRNRARNRIHRRRNYSRHNPRSVRVVYRTRRHNRRHNRRRNQGHNLIGGDAGKVIATLGGATVTAMVTGFLPSTMTTGVMGYITTGVTAIVLGQVAGRAFKSKPIGTFVTVGGLLIVALNLVQQFFPQLALPFTTSAGTSGMGLITSSNFFVPQVNQNGSMASFIAPAAIPAAVPVAVASGGMSGLGQGTQPILGLRTMRRVGRMR